MKIIMVMVSSVNGKITNQNNPNIYSWTSKEDSEHFFSLINDNNLIVMGRKTFESAGDKIKLLPDKLRIVLTHSPDKYNEKEVTGQLEFSNEKVKKLVSKLKGLGYKKMLIVGGAQINKLFLQAGLVNEIYLTLEPKLFGKGKELLEPFNLQQNLRLVSYDKLNHQGTLLLHYKLV